MKTLTSTVKLPVSLINILKARKRPHQSIAGVIEELLYKNNISPIPDAKILADKPAEDIDLKPTEQQQEPVALPEGYISSLEALSVILKKTEKVVTFEQISRWASKGLLKTEVLIDKSIAIELDSLNSFLEHYTIK